MSNSRLKHPELVGSDDRTTGITQADRPDDNGEASREFISRTPKHRLLREVFRHYTEFKQLFTSEGIDTIDYAGFSISLWDLQDALKPQSEGGILSDRKLEAVYYNVVQDMKQKDVAEIMGITTVSVGQYVEQAMIQLSEKYFADELVSTD
jgi:hypothetical protein